MPRRPLVGRRGGGGGSEWCPDGGEVAVVLREWFGRSAVLILDAATGEERAEVPLAGATPVALARSGAAGNGKVVCVVSGGNIDSAKLAELVTA